MKLVYKNADDRDLKLLIDIYDSAFYDDYVRYGQCQGYGRSLESMA